ncbi:MAG: hypothetical protein K1X86_00305 [Ignavibacteria bacterium]|nr:hypothetical protein [Ignavibacteria bacterium]
MKYFYTILLFLYAIFFIACGKKQITTDNLAKDSSATAKSDKLENVTRNNETNKQTDENKINFITYCNSKYNYCIQYPDILVEQKESENLDENKWQGAKFVSKNGKIRMTTFGWDNDNVDMQYQMKQEGLEVTYKVKKKSFFVVSGWNKDGSGYYSKTKIIRDKNGNIDHVISFDFTFTAEEKPVCAPIIEYIENHF